jgi:hypothetical protein
MKLVEEARMVFLAQELKLVVEITDEVEFDAHKTIFIIDIPRSKESSSIGSCCVFTFTLILTKVSEISGSITCLSFICASWESFLLDDNILNIFLWRL